MTSGRLSCLERARNYVESASRRTIAQVVQRRLLSTEVRVQVQASPCEICCGLSNTTDCFSSRTSLYPYLLLFHQSYFRFIPTCCYSTNPTFGLPLPVIIPPILLSFYPYLLSFHQSYFRFTPTCYHSTKPPFALPLPVIIPPILLSLYPYLLLFHRSYFRLLF
jgi:hypothetical protein